MKANCAIIIGPNGAGKSTMLDLITGRTKPDKGKIEFGRDTDLTRLNEYQINRLGIGRKFQTPSVYIDHTVFENIWLSLKGSRAVWSHNLSRGFHPINAIASMRCSTPWAFRQGRLESRRAEPWPEAVARNRHVARARPEALARG